MSTNTTGPAPKRAARLTHTITHYNYGGISDDYTRAISRTYEGFQDARPNGDTPAYVPAPEGANYLAVVYRGGLSDGDGPNGLDLWWLEDRKVGLLKLRSYYDEWLPEVTNPFLYQVYPVAR